MANRAERANPWELTAPSGYPAVSGRRHRKRIRKEVRAANGKLRALLKKIPWR
ncbi:MAG: hypothetical protein GY719_21865 [bacterium]|nr:hypothetical protein [bacterium]